MKKLLASYGEDPGREGLKETPGRYIHFLDDFLSEKKFNMTTFDAEGYREIIVEKDIPFYSLCEHHTLPFFGVATIAYVPDKKIVGLSKIPRVLDKFAHNLQNQERITMQIAEYLSDFLEPKGVAVSLSARHMCMEMRGVKKPHTETRTFSFRGVFKKDGPERKEFISIIDSSSV